MNSLEIEVVDIAGKPFFQIEDVVCLDVLDAGPFEGGQLSVINGQVTVDSTKWIGLHGTHAPTVCYVGLKRMPPTNCLFPEEFTVGVIIAIGQLPEDRNPRRALDELLEYYQSSEPAKVDCSHIPPVLNVRYEGYQTGDIRKVY